MLFRVLSVCLVVVLSLSFSKESFSEVHEWTEKLRRELLVLEEAFPGRFGLYAKDLATGRELSYRGDESWYVASGVKVPVAIEVLRQVATGKLSLGTRIRLEARHYVDGAGGTNWKSVGSGLTIRYLLEQMLIHSDNTATDMLLEQVGLARVNQVAQELAPNSFGEITSLAGVRRALYGEIHPQARMLSGQHMLVLASVEQREKRVPKLALLLGIEKSEMQATSLASAYSAYYATGLNSATLRGYGRMIEALVRGAALDSRRAKILIEMMERVETGKRRIRAGLPRSFRFAHKTGTQHERSCDLGVAWAPRKPDTQGVIIAACTSGIATLAQSEDLLKGIGAAVYRSGAFSD